MELGALVSFLVLYFFFRKEKEKVKLIPVEKVKSWVPTVLLVSLIVLLALSSFIDAGFSYMAGIICMAFGIISLVWAKVFHQAEIIKSIKSLDWDTTLFLAGIFIIVGSITSTGWIKTIADSLSAAVGENIFLGYTVIVFLSVAISAFVDNVPFLAAMLPVAISMSQTLGISPSLFLFGLLIGTSLGGNITPYRGLGQYCGLRPAKEGGASGKVYGIYEDRPALYPGGGFGGVFIYLVCLEIKKLDRDFFRV